MRESILGALRSWLVRDETESFDPFVFGTITDEDLFYILTEINKEQSDYHIIATDNTTYDTEHYNDVVGCGEKDCMNCFRRSRFLFSKKYLKPARVKFSEGETVE